MRTVSYENGVSTINLIEGFVLSIREKNEDYSIITLTTPEGVEYESESLTGVIQPILEKFSDIELIVCYSLGKELPFQLGRMSLDSRHMDSIELSEQFRDFGDEEYDF